ncbi:actin-like protein 6A isoform X2 [Trichoplusia ni]|uniref:Actin-like protein 6A isoform X2 n=1 Tax=Trichoplusia ni TaxID=7111 RepID=A0A7E5W788_TRINI|nr:actin-like protein 6A isoform X2 [Trichoplusia ni]
MSGPNGMLYGGDEIGALVFDPGHHSLRVGYAQEDTPKADIPAVVGTVSATHIPDAEEKVPDGNVTQTGSKTGGELRHYIDITELHVPRAGMEVHTYMKDGQVDNWDLFEKMLDYCYAKVIRSPSEHHPALFTEAVWTTRPAREKLAELLFEKYQAPAFFLVKSAVLAAFANGKSTALVVDAGASQTSAVPVIDGYALVNAAVRSPVGGDHLAAQAKHMLNNMHIQMLPLYSIQSKEVIRERERGRYTLKTLPAGLTVSWQQYMLKRQYEDFCHCVAQVSESQYEERAAASAPFSHYEFPGGYHQDFGPERFKLTECLFEPTLGAPHLACAAAAACDADARPALWGSVVACGGVASAPGWLERLAKELAARAPSSHRLKSHAAPNSTERRFAAWIGGSILASIGSFQQMWISSQEYDEGGKGQLERKCP